MMNSTGSRSLCCGTLVVLMMAAAGCVAEAKGEPPSIVGAVAEASEAQAISAEEAATDRAPTLDDLTAPAVDENDPASVEARAMYELVGPEPVGAGVSN
jgi:hypothetical protein